MSQCSKIILSRYLSVNIDYFVCIETVEMFTENSNETSAHLYRSRRYGKSFIGVVVEELRGTKSLSRKYENPILSIFVAAYYINHIVVDILHKVSFQNGFCPQRVGGRYYEYFSQIISNRSQSKFIVLLYYFEILLWQSRVVAYYVEIAFLGSLEMQVKRRRCPAICSVVKDSKIREVASKIEKFAEIRQYLLRNMFFIDDSKMYRKNRIWIYQYLEIAHFDRLLLLWSTVGTEETAIVR